MWRGGGPRGSDEPLRRGEVAEDPRDPPAVLSHGEALTRERVLRFRVRKIGLRRRRCHFVGLPLQIQNMGVVYQPTLPSNTPGGSVRRGQASLTGLVLSCIEAKICKKICVGISYLFEKKIEKKGHGRKLKKENLDKLESSRRDLHNPLLCTVL